MSDNEKNAVVKSLHEALQIILEASPMVAKCKDKNLNACLDLSSEYIAEVWRYLVSN
jgi:hypothetical protein